MSQGPTIGEDELVAYTDGRLQKSRAREIDALMEVNPVLHEQVDRDRAIAADLRQVLAPKAEEAVPAYLSLDALVRNRQRRRNWTWVQSAAATVLFAAGIAAGWIGHEFAAGTGGAGTGGDLVADAALAHRTYTAERRHAVEVAASEQEHLVSWLGNRLNHELAAPDLIGEGYRLMGGRLLPSPAGPAGQLMYEDDAGTRLTLYVRPEPGEAVSFRFAEADGTSAFYWIEGGLAYSLAGDLPRDALMRLARIVYRELAGT